MTEVVKMIAKEWRDLDKSQKNKFKELAKLDKERFERELLQLTTLKDQ